MQKITPFFWFENQAEEAARFYVSIFKNASLGAYQYYSSAGPGQEGSVLTVTFTLFGQEFVALNGGPEFHFTPAVSFFVHCETQEEIDYYWEKLSAGGEKSQCGWLTDRYGVSWQIAPTILGDMLRDSDGEKVTRVTRAMLQMTRLDIQKLREAYEQS